MSEALRIAAGLHDYLKFHMESTGIQKIEAPLLTDEEIDEAIGFYGLPGVRVDARLIEKAVRQKARLK